MQINSKIKTGLIFAVLLVLLLLINSYFLWLVLYILATIIGYLEACKLFKTQENYLFLTLGLIIASISYEPVLASIFTIMLYASFIAYTQDDLKKLLPFIYALLGISFIFESYLKAGVQGFLWLLISVIACDSFAYFIGKKFGKTPFSKSSPNKTLEGVIGGVGVGFLLSFLYSSFAFKDLSVFVCLSISFAMSFLAVFGDLFESYLKRLAEVKDSGELFPGHGGVLDRVDALIFASIAMAVFL